MKNLQNKIYGWAVLILSVWLFTTCQDLKFGDAFLEKAPAGDVDINYIYSSALTARRALWAAYETLPYGLNTSAWSTRHNMINQDVLESLTDLSESTLSWGGAMPNYYGGSYTAETENGGGGVKYPFTARDSWLGIRRAWLFIGNVDVVPDMTEEEKIRLKAEARMVIALHYCDMFRHYGGVPWVDHAFTPNDEFDQPRETAYTTLQNIVDLIDEAIPDLPWALQGEDLTNWFGRFTRAGAMGLKARILLFAASPLFNSDKPYMDGEASTQQLTWYGGYKPELWDQAKKAHDDFFAALQQNGYYALVTGSDVRAAYRSAYFDRGTTESLISTTYGYTVPDFWSDGYYFTQSVGYGTASPTQEFVDMFGMANGLPITDPNSGYDKDYPYRNRDPRLYESVVVVGDRFLQRYARSWAGGRDRVDVTPDGGWGSGYKVRKFHLDGDDLPGKLTHWPYLRLAEMYLNYAEILNQLNGPTAEAYRYVNMIRDRVGVGPLKPGLSQDEFLEALLVERACEFGYEEVRWFDIIRYKREDIFKKPLHRVVIYLKDPDDPNKDPDVTGIEPTEFTFEYIARTPRSWARTFSPKWYLSAFPTNEIYKEYGLIQNPGW
ncbi:MAG: RagB/SusD family nutrient uptake outer membrane protein [Tannerellaceae bacterium]|nr:RagB/SusD family nutrient uptake outer membrane protein [Tannerellaceae bacterium]